MERLIRNSTPLILYKKIANEFVYVRKGKAWKSNYDIHHNGGAFQWGSLLFNGIQTNIGESIIEVLQNLSNEHCHYCDRKQIRKGDVRPTIDHFCPKTIKPIKAFQWGNLFLACDSCQEYKGTRFSKKNLLKFDELAYNFNDYFYFDFDTAKVLTRPDISIENRHKARYTLTVLGINKNKRKESRLNEFEDFVNTIEAKRNIDNFSFRYFIKRAI
jgi:uncharacterized protein (TIGR02646 family)